MVRQWNSECCQLAQKKYTTKHDRVGKMITGELRKRIKFDHAAIITQSRPKDQILFCFFVQ